MILTYYLLQSVATFFSHVMAAIGGNSAGPGMDTIPMFVIGVSVLNVWSILVSFCAMKQVMLLSMFT